MSVTLETRVTPYSFVPARLARARKPAIRRLVNLCLFSAPPTLMFWWWYFSSSVYTASQSNPTFRWAFPVAALLITITPLVVQEGEFLVARVLDDFNEHGTENGWDLAAMNRRLNRWDRTYPWVFVIIGLWLPLATALSYPKVTGFLSVNELGWQLAGVVVTGASCIAISLGIWVLAKSVAMIHSAASAAKIRWNPFHTGRVWGVTQLYSLAWRLGLLVSLGPIGLPAGFAILGDLSLASQFAVWIFVAFLLLGGFAAFVIPAFLLWLVCQRGKAAALDALAIDIDRALSKIRSLDEPPSPEEVARFEALLSARRAIQATPPSPFSFGFLGRATTTLILPVTLTVIQALGAR